MSLSLWKEVDVLREKIKDSEVKVEVDSQNSNLAEMVNKIRNQYDKLSKKNLKETEEWYQSKARVTRGRPCSGVFCLQLLLKSPSASSLV